MKGTIRYADPTPGVGLGGNVRHTIKPLTYAESLCFECERADCPTTMHVGYGCAKEDAERAAKAGRAMVAAWWGGW